MQLSKFFALALATSISAAPADQAGASPQAIGVSIQLPLLLLAPANGILTFFPTGYALRAH